MKNKMININKESLIGREIAIIKPGVFRDSRENKIRELFFENNNKVIHLGDPNSESELAYVYLKGYGACMIPRSELSNTGEKYKK